MNIHKVQNEMCNANVLIFSWLLPLHLKIDTFPFEVSFTNHSKSTTKKQFQRKLTILSHKQTLLRNSYIEKKEKHNR